MDANLFLRIHTKNPGYHSRLPKVFPYYWQGSLEEVENLTSILMLNSVAGWVDSAGVDGGLWFAVTGHSGTLDGHITLWLSAQAAHFQSHAA